MSSKHIHKQTKQSGFTLLEMMIVLLIAGILLAYGVPEYRAFGLSQRVSNEANDLLGDLMYARVTAIKEGRTVTLLSASGTDWSDGWSVFLDTNRDSAIDAGEVVLRQKQGINQSLSLTGTGTSVRFNNIGNANAANNVVITHSSSSKTVTLRIAASGMISSSN